MTSIESKDVVPYSKALSTIGDRIAEARKRVSWRQKDLASALSQSAETKASRITVGVWEKNETTPTVQQVFAIAAFTKVDPYWILTGRSESSGDPSSMTIIHAATLEADGTFAVGEEIPVSRFYFSDYEGTIESLLSVHYEHGACEFGQIDTLIIDTSNTAPTGHAQLFAYLMSPGEVAMAQIKKIAPRDGKERIHVKNTDLMVDDTLFLDETKILGRIVRWAGH